MDRQVKSVAVNLKTDTRKETLRSEPNDEGASSLWESVRTIIALQNQAPELKPFNQHSNIPVSFNQERLWLLSQLRQNTSAYNIPFAFRLLGDLNIDILERSLQILIQRHESLRTTFTPISPHKAVQQINRVPDKILKYYDLRSYSLSSCEVAFKILREEAQLPFNLNKGPLFQVKLLSIGIQDHILMFNIHHAIFDGWSEGILFREISILYESLLEGEIPPLAPPKIQYSDFSIWQRQWIKGDFRKTLLKYWHQTLRGYVQQLALPSDYPCIAEQNCRGDQEIFFISSSLSNELKRLARQERATLFPILLTAFKVLLYHYTQQVDICVCTPTANRNRSELKGVIGYFINMLILRTDLAENPSFRQLLGRVKQSIAGANAHQDLPIQALTSCLEGGHFPLSQVLFAFQNTPQASLSLHGLAVERIDIDNGTADFDLFLSLTEETGRLKGILKYNSDLFKADTISLLVQRYVHILTAISTGSDTSIDQLLSFSAAERQALATVRGRNMAKASSHERKIRLSPRNAIEEKLVTIWQDILNLQHVGIQDNFFDLGGKSIVAFELFTQIEVAFDQSLPLSTLIQSPTIEQLATVISQQDQSGSCSPLVALQPYGSRPPFFCVHGKGGNVLGLHALANLVGVDQPFYGLQSRSLDGKSLPAVHIEDIAKDYAQEIKRIQPEGPYFIGGYSLGGNIALEIAQQLRQQGEVIGLLVFLDSVRELSLFKRLLYDMGNLLRSHVHPVTYAKYIMGYCLHKLNQKKHSRKASDPSSRAIAPIHENSTIDDIKNRVLKANLKALKNYKPKPYFGNLTILRATKRNISQQHVYRIPSLGWKDIVRGTIEVHSISSSHGKMLVQPSVKTVAQVLGTCLDKAQKVYSCANQPTSIDSSKN